MRRRHVLLAAADEEIDDQIAWYAEHAGPRVAKRFYAEIKSTIAQMLRRPRRGRPFSTHCPSLAGVRTWPLKHFPFLIFYREAELGIEILHVRHGARDHDRLQE